MPVSEAWRRCPAAPFGPAIYIRGTRGLYSRASRKVMACLREPAVLFEKASIDEAYLDVTETVGGDWDAALALANQVATGDQRTGEPDGLLWDWSDTNRRQDVQ